ncbi:unnamed protein product, partial [Rhizoctonia solani]
SSANIVWHDERSSRWWVPSQAVAAIFKPHGIQIRTQHVIQISELLVMIAQQLDAKKQRILLLVSKHFFQSIGPLVWKRVPGLDVIMKLIKDVKAEFNRSRVRGYSEWYDHCRWTLTLPSNPDLSRYEIYSPWIHELEIFAGYDQEIENLEPFLARLDGHPPLPNLQRITTYTTLSIGGERLMNFINIFINPSLTEIRTIIPNNGLPRSTDSRVPSSTVLSFLRKIKEVCPRIRVLELYPENHNSRKNGPPELYRPNDQYLGVLACFPGLRSFSSNTYILESATFGILGELPYLESLGIRGTPTEHSILGRKDQTLLMPETWFPSLKNLRLYDVHPEDVKYLWSQPTVAQKLVSVLIQTDYSELLFRNPLFPILVLDCKTFLCL